MKIKYKFATGEVTEVEVSDEIGAVITASRKAEHALEERNRYHCYSLDAIDYEGLEYGECDEYPIEDDSTERAKRINTAFSHLTEVQQRRLRLYADGKTLREIAALENTRFQSVAESIEAAKKKFLKKYRPHPDKCASNTYWDGVNRAMVLTPTCSIRSSPPSWSSPMGRSAYN